MNSQKQRFPNQRQTTQTSNRVSQEIHLSESPIVETPEEKFPDKPSYLKYTFANPYNLTLLGGALIASVLTLNPLIAVAALGNDCMAQCFVSPRVSSNPCEQAASLRPRSFLSVASPNAFIPLRNTAAPRPRCRRGGRTRRLCVLWRI